MIHVPADSPAFGALAVAQDCAGDDVEGGGVDALGVVLAAGLEDGDPGGVIAADEVEFGGLVQRGGLRAHGKLAPVWGYPPHSFDGVAGLLTRAFPRRHNHIHSLYDTYTIFKVFTLLLLVERLPECYTNP